MSARCRCVCSEKIEQQLHAEVVDRRAEEHRRLLAGKISRFIERMRSTLHQLQLVAQLVELRLAQALAQRWRIDRRKDGGVVTGEIAAGLVHMHFTGLQMYPAAQTRTRAGVGRGTSEKSKVKP